MNTKYLGSVLDRETPATIVVSRILGATVTSLSLFLIYAVVFL